MGVPPPTPDVRCRILLRSCCCSVFGVHSSGPPPTRMMLDAGSLARPGLVAGRSSLDSPPALDRHAFFIVIFIDFDRPEAWGHVGKRACRSERANNVRTPHPQPGTRREIALLPGLICQRVRSFVIDVASAECRAVTPSPRPAWSPISRSGSRSVTSMHVHR